jgi:mono/diheme cytochrome c family protein
MRTAILVALLGLAIASGLADIKKVGTAGGPIGGKELFTAYCASCHGPDGKGRGTVTLRVPASDLTTLSLRNHGVYPFARVSGTISGDLARPEYNGRQMPCFGLIFRSLPAGDRTTAQNPVAALTEYIRSLQAR